MTATVEGDDEEDAETESTYFTIGEEEYNA
jgi:hypothetical protein